MYTLNLTKIEFLIINLFIILIFGLIYTHYGTEEYFSFYNNKTNMDFTDGLYFSANTYITIGNSDIYPKTKYMKCVIMIQIFFALITIIMLSSYDKI